MARCPLKEKEKRRRHYLKNREKEIQRSSKWNKDNKERRRGFKNAWHKRKMLEDPKYVLLKRLRNRLNAILKRINTARCETTKALLGCTPQFFKQHIESLFLPGMTWENRTKWDLDHIKCCASFDLTDPEEQRKCFHYSNIAPLWKKLNQQKGAKLIY